MYKHNEEIAYLCEDSKKPWDETHNLQQVRVWSPGVQLRVSGLLWSSGVSSKENTTCKELLRALKGLYDGVTGNHEVTGNHGESPLSRHLTSSHLIRLVSLHPKRTKNGVIPGSNRGHLQIMIV